MIRAVLFDLDGVLADLRDLHYRALNAALSAHGCTPIDPKQHKNLYDGLPTKTKLKMLVDRGLVRPEDVESITALKQKETVNLISRELQFDPQIFCLVHGIRAAGRKWGVVTNAVPQTALLVLDTLQMPGCDILVTNHDAKPKPSPEGYQLACYRLGISPVEALVIEDGKYGIEAAKAAGCRVMEVTGPADVTAENVWKHLKGN